MNILLVFAFIAALFAVIRDFIDSHWLWENKNLFSIILAVFAFVPTAANFLVFVSSDSFCLLEIKYQILKAIMMDYFPDFMSKRVINGKGIYCNQSSLCATVFDGGLILIMSVIKCSGIMMPKVKFEIETEDLCRFLEVYIGDISVWLNTNSLTLTEYRTEGINRALDGLGSVFRASCEIIDKKGFITLSDKNKVLVRVSDLHHKFIVEFSDSLFKIILLDNEVFVVDISKSGMNKEFIHKMMPQIFIKFYKIGLLEFKVDIRYITYFYKGKVHRLYRHFLPLNKLISLITALDYWSDNPGKGVIEQESSMGFRKRRGSTILHAIKLEEICFNLRNGYKFSWLVLKKGNYRVEGNDEDGLLVKTLKSILGDINFKILTDRIDQENFQFNVKCEILSNILYQRSGFCYNKLFGTERCGRVRKLLSDLDYLLRLIGYGCITFYGQKKISNKFVQICRGHTPIETQITKTPFSQMIKDSGSLVLNSKLKVLNDKVRKKSGFTNPGHLMAKLLGDVSTVQSSLNRNNAILPLLIEQREQRLKVGKFVNEKIKKLVESGSRVSCVGPDSGVKGVSGASQNDILFDLFKIRLELTNLWSFSEADRRQEVRSCVGKGGRRQALKDKLKKEEKGKGKKEVKIFDGEKRKKRCWGSYNKEIFVDEALEVSVEKIKSHIIKSKGLYYKNEMPVFKRHDKIGFKIFNNSEFKMYEKELDKMSLNVKPEFFKALKKNFSNVGKISERTSKKEGKVENVMEEKGSSSSFNKEKQSKRLIEIKRLNLEKDKVIEQARLERIEKERILKEENKERIKNEMRIEEENKKKNEEEKALLLKKELERKEDLIKEINSDPSEGLISKILKLEKQKEGFFDKEVLETLEFIKGDINEKDCLNAFKKLEDYRTKRGIFEIYIKIRDNGNEKNIGIEGNLQSITKQVDKLRSILKAQSHKKKNKKEKKKGPGSDYKFITDGGSSSVSGPK